MLSWEWHNEDFKTKTGTGPAINNSNSSSTMALQRQQGHHAPWQYGNNSDSNYKQHNKSTSCQSKSAGVVSDSSNSG